MDPVMQALFGKMPIEQLSAVQAATIKNKNANTIMMIGGVAVVLAVGAYILYKKNVELNQQLIKLKIKQP
jgi:hypothetical protein